MTVKRSIVGLLAVVACLLMVPIGFSANGGEMSTYLPLIQRAIPDKSFLLYSIYEFQTGVDFAVATTPPIETFQLTSDGVNIQPNQRFQDATDSFSPDGALIAFYKYPEPERTPQLWVMNPSGRFSKMVLEGETIGDAAWGPDSATLLYRDDMGVKAININTGVSILLAETATKYLWHPTQMRVYYTVEGQGIMRVNADGTERIQVYNPTSLSIGYILRVLADGRVVFAMGDIDQNELYVIGADGNNLMRLTNDGGGQQIPIVSPDGSSVFYSLGSGKVRIVSMTGETLLEYTMPCANNEVCRRSLYHSWSPDGTEVAFSWLYTPQGGTTTEYALYRVAADGSQATPTLVSRGNNRLRGSAYSPDGRYFAYVGEDENDPKIYLLDRTTNATEVMVEGETSLFVWSWRP